MSSPTLYAIQWKSRFGKPDEKLMQCPMLYRSMTEAIIGAYCDQQRFADKFGNDAAQMAWLSQVTFEVKPVSVA